MQFVVQYPAKKKTVASPIPNRLAISRIDFPDSVNAIIDARSLSFKCFLPLSSLNILEMRHFHVASGFIYAVCAPNTLYGSHIHRLLVHPESFWCTDAQQCFTDLKQARVAHPFAPCQLRSKFQLRKWGLGNKFFTKWAIKQG